MSENLFWEARTFSDKVLKAEVQNEIVKLAYVLLGNHQLKIEEDKEGFDPYTFCKHDTKKWCPVGNKKKYYRGRWREYVVYGSTRIDVYLEVLKMLANDSSVYYPVVDYRRDNEWIEREEHDETLREASAKLNEIKALVEDEKLTKGETADKIAKLIF